MLKHPNLVGYWRLEGDAVDASDTGNNGVLNGPAPTFALMGRGFAFDGVDDIITVSTPSFANDFSGSVSMWLKASGVAVQQSVVALTTDSAPNDDFAPCSLRPDDNDQIQIILRVNGGTVNRLESPNGSITDTNFHHWMVTSNGATTRAYLDGLEVILTATTGPNLGRWFGNATDADTFSIGAVKRTTSVQHWGGTIDEVSVFNRDLLEPDVKRIMLGMHPLA